MDGYATSFSFWILFATTQLIGYFIGLQIYSVDNSARCFDSYGNWQQLRDWVHLTFWGGYYNHQLDIAIRNDWESNMFAIYTLDEESIFK